jgi:hypothetical protein
VQTIIKQQVIPRKYFFNIQLLIIILGLSDFINTIRYKKYFFMILNKVSRYFLIKSNLRNQLKLSQKINCALKEKKGLLIFESLIFKAFFIKLIG